MNKNFIDKYESLPLDKQALVNKYINEILEKQILKKKLFDSKEEKKFISNEIIDASIKSTDSPKNIFGILKGKIKISDDFNEEISDFSEYQ